MFTLEDQFCHHKRQARAVNNMVSQDRYGPAGRTGASSETDEFVIYAELNYDKVDIGYVNTGQSI